MWDIVKSSVSRTQIDANGEEGVELEEGTGIIGTASHDFQGNATSQSKVDKWVSQSGDGSFHYQQRHNFSQHGSREGGYGRVVGQQGGQYGGGAAGGRTVTTVSKFNTTYINGQPVGRRYENTTTVRGSDGKVIDSKVVTGKGLLALRTLSATV